MIRLDLKGQLIGECCALFETLGYFKECCPKSFNRRAVKTINKDFKKGVRAINEKAKVFIELPKFESKGNGVTAEVYVKDEPITALTVIDPQGQ